MMELAIEISHTLWRKNVTNAGHKLTKCQCLSENAYLQQVAAKLVVAAATPNIQAISIPSWGRDIRSFNRFLL